MGTTERPEQIIPPTLPTLKKWGLTIDEWWGILESQGYVCPICTKVPSSGRFVVDHEHVKGWKQMPPEERKKYIRGITCWFCNHAYLARGINIQKAWNVYMYLVRFEEP